MNIEDIELKIKGVSLDFIDALLTKCGGVGGIKSFLDGEMILVPNNPMFRGVAVPAWQVVHYDNGPVNGHEYVELLRESGYWVDENIPLKISNAADGKRTERALLTDMFNEAVPKNKSSLQLALVTRIDLGLSRGFSLKLLQERAALCGLELCPPWVGPQLLLNGQIKIDRDSEVKQYFIGMDSLWGSKDSGHFKSNYDMFRIKRDNYGRIGLNLPSIIGYDIGSQDKIVLVKTEK